MKTAIHAAQDGDETAVLAILDSVEGIVRRAVQRRWRPGMDVEDLAQEGRVAALEALKRYRPEGGAKFSTYAYLRIVRAVADYAAMPVAVHVPPHAVATFRACLGKVGGDVEAAEYLATVLPGPGHRMSPATAHAVRLALQPAEAPRDVA
ncbi:sigma factor [Streptomyces sp. NPDC002992]|uniref:sigma-70 family RNA polymerase sigma factor n=1 Tax=Streptomyces sp. NPDC002992 TaxID=3154273 RepID=UPI0033B78BAD